LQDLKITTIKEIPITGQVYQFAIVVKKVKNMREPISESLKSVEFNCNLLRPKVDQIYLEVLNS